jgi:hypothetical protein
MGRPRRNVNGQTFGRITVLKDTEGGKNPRVQCVCSCGKRFMADKHNVIRGNTKSCGCLKTEKAGRYVRKKKEPAAPRVQDPDTIDIMQGIADDFFDDF